MKTIEFNNNQISIPTSWNEITLGEYEQWNTNGNYFQYLASVCKTDVSILQEASAEVLQGIEECLSFLFERDFRPSESIEIGGVTYYITATDEVSIGTVIDMETLHEEGQSPQLSDSLALLCKPLAEIYDGDAAKVRGQLFRKQSCQKILPLVHYFLQREQSLQKVWQDSLQILTNVSQFVEESKELVKNENNLKELSPRQKKRHIGLIESLDIQLAQL